MNELKNPIPSPNHQMMIVEWDWRQGAYLVALDAPHFDDARLHADQLERVEAIENGAAVRSVILFNVNAGRVRFREVRPVKAHTPQGFRNELEMINFLYGNQQTDLFIKNTSSQSFFVLFVCLFVCLFISFPFFSAFLFRCLSVFPPASPFLILFLFPSFPPSTRFGLEALIKKNKCESQRIIERRSQ